MRGFLLVVAAGTLGLGAAMAPTPAEARISEATCMRAWEQCQAGNAVSCETVDICIAQRVTPWLDSPWYDLARFK